ncbi:MAG: hypothetical protein SH850_30525 [Planctomycetaceae bacterium]|nr:hypothetical protein [Planctomycetaceae bacterium]
MSDLEKLSSELRSINPYLHIDPGFINRRKCYSIFGNDFVKEFEAKKRPSEAWPHSVFNDHLIIDLALRYCRSFGVKTLGESLATPRRGQLFCSTESLAGNDEVYDKARIANQVLVKYEVDREVWLEFGTSHFVSDTGKLEQSIPSQVAVIGEFREITNEKLTIHPLIMGAPTFDHPWNKEFESNERLDLFWHGGDWFQTFPEDIGEFSAMRGQVDPKPKEWMDYMQVLSELDVKSRFCEILGDVSKKDWGGELDDHFSTSVHLVGRRVPTAFAFKGPASFREMTPDHLGKRADQIFRLASTPAELLVVQHCHTIGEAVRATLRAFAVAPHNPRRYCLIDGKDTYKLFVAYGKL